MGLGKRTFLEELEQYVKYENRCDNVTVCPELPTEHDAFKNQINEIIHPVKVSHFSQP